MDKKDSGMIVAVVAIICAAVALYYYFFVHKKQQGTDPGPPTLPPGDGDGDGGGEDPVIPGVPQLWELTARNDNPDSRNIMITLSRPVHLTTFSGSIHLSAQHPGDWFKKPAWFIAYVTKEDGTRLQVMNRTPPLEGWTSGWHPISFTVGISNVRTIEIFRQGSVGAGTSTYYIDEIQGEATVIV